MLGANVFVVKSLSFLIRQLHDLAGPVGKSLVHGKPLYVKSVINSSDHKCQEMLFGTLHDSFH